MLNPKGWFLRQSLSWRMTLGWAMVFTAYYLGARMGLALSFPPDFISALWIPNGIYLTALLLTPPRHWWVYLLAVVPAELAADLPMGISWPKALTFVGADTLEVVAAAVPLRVISRGIPSFDTMKQALIFSACAVWGAPFLAAFPGALTSFIGPPGTDYWTAWRTWFLGDALTHLTLTPFLLSWFAGKSPLRGPRPRLKLMEGGTLAVATVLAGVAMAEGNEALGGGRPTFLSLPLLLLLWAGVRFSPRGLFSTSLFFTVVSVLGASGGLGPFTAGTPYENVFDLQVFFLLAFFPLMVLSVLVNEHKRSEREWSRDHDVALSAMETAPVGITLLDRDGRITFANSYAQKHLGVIRSEMQGRAYNAQDWKITDYSGNPFPDEELPFRKVIETGQAVFGVRHAIRSPGGSRILLSVNAAPLFDDKGRVDGVVTAVEDLTGAVRAEAALEASEATFRKIIEALPLGIHMYRLEEDGRLVFEGANPAADRILGTDNRQFVGKTLEEAFPPLAGTEVPARYRRTALTGEPWSSEQVDYRHGSIRGAFEISAFQMGPRRMAVVFSDITGRKRTEEILRQAQKMESVGRLAGGVAHDLNNLLTPILGYADLLFLGTGEKTQERLYAAGIRGAGERARDLTQQLLAFSRRQVLEIRRLDLNQVVREAQKILRPTLREDIRIHLELAQMEIPTRANSSQLEQVLMNLAVNAQDAMPEGGILTLRTGQATGGEEDTPLPSDLEPGKYALLEVRDSGTGMSQDALEHLFEPFFTTKEKGKGTGLGLATVYGIIKQHRGSIRVESSPGKGTAFHIFLPWAEVSAKEPSPPPPPPGKGGNETVLVVEDERMVRALIVQILAGRGYNVLEADTASGGLEKARALGFAVDLLLTDVILPDGNGRELSRRIARERPGLKVLFISGYSEDVISHHGILEEGLSFLPKPFTVEGLSAKVRQVLDGA